MWMESCLLPADLGRGLHHVKAQEKEVKQELWCFLSQITRKRLHFIMKIRHFVLASPLIIEWQLYSAARRNSHFERSYECLVPIWWQWRKGMRISQSKHMEGCFQLLVTWQTFTEGLLCARHSEDIQKWLRKTWGSWFHAGSETEVPERSPTLFHRGKTDAEVRRSDVAGERSQREKWHPPNPIKTSPRTAKLIL